MPDTMESESESLELVVPLTGEIVSREDAPACLRVLREVREVEAHFKRLKAALTEALAEEFSRQGTKTLELSGIKAELKGGSEIVWDVEILEELRELGMPDERMALLITTEVTYKVNANVAKAMAAANDKYAQVIERAQTKIPKSHYVAIK